MHIAALRNFAVAGFVSLMASAGFTSEALALNCQQARQLVGYYFKMHVSYHDFDDELSRRTLDSLIKAWDPGKVYFLKADVKQLEDKYATKLDDTILNSNCGALDEVVKLYSKRFAERQKTISTAIDLKHDFTLDEYMMIDRKKLEWASTTEEIAERWRQRVKWQLLTLKDTLGDVEKAKEKLHKRYQLAAKRQNEMTSDDMYAIFLNAFASSLDPHSEYMPPEALEDFRISTRLSLEGIGAVLRSEDGFTTIQSLVPGGAAAKTGKVKVDDKIIAVAQGAETPVDVIDMDLREVVKLIRGARATEVRLTVVRDDGGKTAQIVVPIIREQIELKDRAAKSQVFSIDVKEGNAPRAYKIGVIELPSFYMDFEGRQNREKGYRSSSVDMVTEVNKLKAQKVDGIVVDLRSNGGGSLDESIAIAGLFFDKGPVVQIKDQRGSIQVQKDEDPSTLYDGPLMVMINRQSASASEIFAGAIQDYHRGLIIGDTHTFGKGTVQNLNDIDEKLGAIKVTISKFYRPLGSSTQLKGVESDVVLPDILDEYEVGEKFYDYAIPWEKLPAASLKDGARVTPDQVLALRKASGERVKTDQGFAKIFADIKEFRDGEASRMRVSLKQESKEAKLAAEKKKDKKKDADDEGEEGSRLSLEEDYHLQETLRVAGDYLQLLNKRPMGQVSLPSLKTVNVVADKKMKGTPEVGVPDAGTSKKVLIP